MSGVLSFVGLFAHKSISAFSALLGYGLLFAGIILLIVCAIRNRALPEPSVRIDDAEKMLEAEETAKVKGSWTLYLLMFFASATVLI